MAELGLRSVNFFIFFIFPHLYLLFRSSLVLRSLAQLYTACSTERQEREGEGVGEGRGREGEGWGREGGGKGQGREKVEEGKGRAGEKRGRRGKEWGWKRQGQWQGREEAGERKGREALKDFRLVPFFFVQDWTTVSCMGQDTAPQKFPPRLNHFILSFFSASFTF